MVNFEINRSEQTSVSGCASVLLVLNLKFYVEGSSLAEFIITCAQVFVLLANLVWSYDLCVI